MFSTTHTIYAWKSSDDKPSNTLNHCNPNGESKWIVFHLPKPSFVFFFSYFESMNELKEGRRMSWRFLSLLSSFLPSSFSFFVFFNCRKGDEKRSSRHPEIQGSSNKLEPCTERKARRARFHACLPFLHLPDPHSRTLK